MKGKKTMKGNPTFNPLIMMVKIVVIDLALFLDASLLVLYCSCLSASAQMVSRAHIMMNNANPRMRKRSCW